MRADFVAAMTLVLCACQGDAAAPTESTQIRNPVTLTVLQATSTDRRYSEPALTQLPNGTLLLAYNHYFARGDDPDSSVIDMLRSVDGGLTWSVPERVATGPHFVCQPSLLVEGDSVHLFFVVRYSQQDTRIAMRSARMSTLQWGAPREIPMPISGYVAPMSDRAVRLSTGRWLYAVPVERSNSPHTPDDPFVAKVLISDDHGRTWQVSDGVTAPEYGADEPSVVQRADGSLLMLVRTAVGYIYAAESFDAGNHWTTARPVSTLPSSDAPQQVKRVPGAAKLVVLWNPPGSGYGRSELAVAESDDGGVSFHRIGAIESRPNFSFAAASLLFSNLYTVVAYWRRDDATVDSTGTGLIDLRVAVLPPGQLYVIAPSAALTKGGLPLEPLPTRRSGRLSVLQPLDTARPPGQTSSFRRPHPGSRPRAAPTHARKVRNRHAPAARRHASRSSGRTGADRVSLSRRVEGQTPCNQPCRCLVPR